MKLKDFFRSQREIRPVDVARACGITTGMVSHLATGRRIPSLPTACKIVAITGGAVSYEDLLVAQVTDLAVAPVEAAEERIDG